MRMIVLGLVLIGCGTQTPEEFFLEEYLRDNPEPSIISTVGGEGVSCWTVDGMADRFLSLPPNLRREEVFSAAAECSRLGQVINSEESL